MGERVFKVCDAKSGSATCDARETEQCVICRRDFCNKHHSPTSLNVTLQSIQGSQSVTRIIIGETCSACATALRSEPIAELFAISPEAVIRHARAHLSAEALK